MDIFKSSESKQIIKTIKPIPNLPAIKSGDVLVFSKTKIDSLAGLFGFIVRFFTMSEFSHVGIAWVNNGEYSIVEAQIPEVRMSPLGSKGSFYYIPMDLDLDPNELQILLDKVGEKYSMWEAIKAYFRRNKVDDDQWICVDLLQYFYNKLGIDIGDNHTPSDIVNHLLQDKHKVLIYYRSTP